jgi:hypothetical protein
MAITKATASSIAPAAKGDLVAGSATNDAAVLGVGANDTVLTADSSTATGLKWAAAASGATLVGTAVYSSSDQTIPNGTFTTVTYGDEYWDTDSFHSTVTNTGRITIPTGKDGKYLVNVFGTWAGAASGNRELRVRKNGSTDLANNRLNGVTSAFTMQMSFQVNLVATDYIELQVYQLSGGNLDWWGSGTFAGSLFAVTYLGA